MNRIIKSESFRAAITFMAFAVMVFVVLAALMVGCDNTLESGSKGNEEQLIAPLDRITYEVPKSMSDVCEIQLYSDSRTNQRWWLVKYGSEHGSINEYVVLPVEPTGDVG